MSEQSNLEHQVTTIEFLDNNTIDLSICFILSTKI